MSKKLYGSLNILDSLSVSGKITSLGKTVPLQITINGVSYSADSSANIDLSTAINNVAEKYVLKTGDTMSGTLDFLNPSTNVYDITSMNNNSTESKKFLRKFRSSSIATIWHETVENSIYRLASGLTDENEVLKLISNGQLYLKGSRVYAENFKPTAADVGALSLTGGTINGAVIVRDNVQSGIFSTNNPSPKGNLTIGSSSDGSVYITGKLSTSSDWEWNTQLKYDTDKSWKIGTNKIYHEGFLPPISDLNGIPGIYNNNPFRIANMTGWQTLARVRIPQTASTASFTFFGGQGFNAENNTQPTKQTLIIRSGNNSPKGISIALYTDGGTTPAIKNVAWKAVTGDDYDIYIQTGSYPNGSFCIFQNSAYASLVSWGTDTPTEAKPVGVTDGTVYTSYNTQFKPDAGEFNAAPSGFGLGTTAIQKTAQDETMGGFWRDVSISTAGITLPYDGTPSQAFLGVDIQTGRLKYGLRSGATTVPINWRNVYSENNKPSAADVGAVPSTAIGTYAETAVPWNAKTGLYAITSEKSTNLLLQLYTGTGISCPSMQLKVSYRNGAIFYRSSRDSFGFEEPFTAFYTEKNPPTAAACNALSINGGTITDSLMIQKSSGQIGLCLIHTNTTAGYARMQLEVQPDGVLDIATSNNGTTNWYYPLKFYKDNANVTVGDTLDIGGVCNSTGNVNSARGTFYSGGTPGGSWSTWQTRNAALKLDCPDSDNSAYNIWKATKPGAYDFAAMLAHCPGGVQNNAIVRIQAGASGYFDFYGNGDFRTQTLLAAGNATINGLMTVSGDRITIKKNGRRHFAFSNAAESYDMYLYKDTGGDGIHLSNGADGGGEWIFGKDSVLTAPGNGSFNDVYIRSDKRLKTNLVKVSSTLDKFSKINTYTYDKKISLDSDDYFMQEMGLVAQEVIEQFPRAVSYSTDTNGNRILVISNAAINSALVSAVNELNDKCSKLESELNSLKSLINKLLGSNNE